MKKDVHANSSASFTEQKKEGKLESFRLKIWTLFSESVCPLTDRDIMRILKESDVNNVRPEISRLKQDLLIQELGKVKCAHTGKTVRISTVTDLPYRARQIKKTPQKDLFT